MAGTVQLETIREFMRIQYAEDQQVQSVTTEGDTVEDALEQASIELGIPVAGLQYEVLRQGRSGVLGVGRVSWMVVAYQAAAEDGDGFDDALLDGISKPEAQQPLDGEALVRLTSDGVMLKVTSPVAGGQPVNERMAHEALSRRGVADYSTEMVGRVVKHADGNYIKVADYQFNPASQSHISVNMTEEEMKAFMVVSAPGPGGADLTGDEIRAYMEGLGIVHGVLEDTIGAFEDRPQYDEPVLIAEGTKPANGRDAQVAYLFKTDRSQLELKEKKDGKVDFKELGLIENVEAGQVVAKKIPAEEGQPGKTVTGRMLPAKPGSEVEIGCGKNVRLAEDGQSAISEINGQVMLHKDRINVEPIYLVPGDVNNKTGNILFLGTVVVKGNVEDGFEVKAAGDIEVRGSVGKAVLDAEGTITVYQGVLGKSGGYVRAGGDVFAKFIEHARVQSDHNVVVTDGIIHSRVDANEQIICQGKRAQIVGGHLRAAQEVITKVIGSVSGTETVIEAGFDPQSVEKLNTARKEKERVEKEMPEVNLNIQTIENLEKVQKKLPADKEESLQLLKEKKAKLTVALNEANKEIGQINAHLETVATRGRISAAGRVYQGVKLYIKNGQPLAVRNEFKGVTFYLEGKDIKVTQYDAPEDLPKRR